MVITKFIPIFVLINKWYYDIIMITKEQFEELIDEKLIKENGKLVYDGNLDLEKRKDVTELPDNLKVLGYLDLNGSSVTKLPKGLEIEGWLSISRTEIEELPEDTKIGSYFCVNDMKKPFSFPRVVKVEDCLDCIDTTIKRMPEELYVEDVCNFPGSTFDKLPEVMEVGNSLYLYNTAITELPKGLKEVYGRLSISNTKVTKLPDNLVVYEEVYLCNTQIEELPKGLIVGGELNLRKTNLKDYSNLHKVCSEFIVTKEKYEEIKGILAEHIKEQIWPNELTVIFKLNYKGAYLFENEVGRYIEADGIFAKILEQKGNVYHIDMYGDGEIAYLITDGEGRWSHGDTLEEAKDDLLYKISKRNKDDYEGLTMDSELSFEDAIVCYRVITGACSFGTRDFINNRLGKNKKEVYTIKEIIELTEGEYGNTTFNNFFYRD